MRHIANKQEFYSLSRKLLLGNILRQWTWEEFISLYKDDRTKSQLPEVVGVRHACQSFTKTGNYSGLMPRQKAYWYGVNASDKRNLLYDEGAVHGNLTLQGEVTGTHEGLYLRYSHLQVHQRTLWRIDNTGTRGLKSYQLPHNGLSLAQRRGNAPVVKHATGLRASQILKQHLDPDSWHMMNRLLGCQHDDQTLSDQTLPHLNFTYPVVEFASFSKPIGVMGWNSVFWEVRTRY